jgi:hypothetical protein
MDVVITEWALQSYLDLVATQAFTSREYWDVIRPDVERLKTDYPNGVKFQSDKFWGPSRVAANVTSDGFKMKWHNMGSGAVQIRGSIAVIGSRAYLCRGFVKDNNATDQREAMKLKAHIQFIRLGRYVQRGLL